MDPLVQIPHFVRRETKAKGACIRIHSWASQSYNCFLSASVVPGTLHPPTLAFPPSSRKVCFRDILNILFQRRNWGRTGSHPLPKTSKWKCGFKPRASDSRGAACRAAWASVLPSQPGPQ